VESPKLNGRSLSIETKIVFEDKTTLQTWLARDNACLYSPKYAIRESAQQSTIDAKEIDASTKNLIWYGK
jgi:hypothetical protein